MRQGTNLPHSIDFVGRLFNPQTKTGNYDQNAKPRKYIILHTMEGTLNGSIAWFKNPSQYASANYCISSTGKIVRTIPEDANSYASGNYAFNSQGINIEHEDGYNPVSNKMAAFSPRPEELYRASGALVADIAKHYGIPLEVTDGFSGKPGIILHRDVPHPTVPGKTIGQVSQKPCPGTLELGKILEYAKQANQQVTQPIANTEQLVSHMLYPSVFANLVTKATTADFILEGLGIKREFWGDPKIGVVALTLIQDKINQAREQGRGEGRTTINTSSISNTPTMPQTGIPTITLSPEDNMTPQKQSVWKKDILGLLKNLLTNVKSTKVTMN